MRKWLLVSISLLLIAAGSFAYLYFSGRDYVFRTPQSQLQAKMNEVLPITKSYLVLGVTLENPRIALKEGSDRINAGLDVVLNIKVDGVSLGGSIDISGGVRYDNEHGAFHLASSVIEKFNVTGIPRQYTELARTALSKILTEYYSRYPVYTLNASDIKQAAIRMTLKSVVVENAELVVVLGL
ncbi:MAG: DUF1439 domain-containing protein [Candidatus Accumulibacter sp.]|jgi:hypothetical protein|nr:DUF1439 domain-containing protein [Accumulibacter sp.]